MLWMRWAFIILNVIYSVKAVGWSLTHTRLNSYGKLASASIWIWQLLGVAIVVWYGFSAWNLLWWVVVGYVLGGQLARIMDRMGYST